MISTRQRLFPFLLSGLLSFSAISIADEHDETEKDKDKPFATWDVLNPPMTLSSVEINTDETTWSSLDVSPDGKRFVFDMLGDIFIASINGGDAKPLTQDFAWNIHPTISPDGKKLPLFLIVTAFQMFG